MDHVELLLVKMSIDAVTPTRATEGSVGLDFYSPADYIIPPYSQLLMHALATGSATVNLSWAYSGFNSTSLLFGTGCVDGSGSLSGGALNQLKLVTLSIV